MSRGYDYQIEGIRNSSIDKIARYVLQPVLGNNAVEPREDQEQAAVAAVKSLLKSWRARVFCLRGKGWTRADKLLLSMLNCPPISVKTKSRPKTVRRCKQHAICPFCWCWRYSVETYRRLLLALYGTEEQYLTNPYTGEREQVIPRPLDLAEVVTTTEYPRKAFEAQQLLNLAAESRTKYLHRIEYLGAFQLFTFEPSDPRVTEPVWRVKHRLLAVMFPESPDPPGLRTAKPPGSISCSRRIKRHKQIRKDMLRAATGRVCLYPEQMLRGSVEDAVQLLNAMNGHSSKGFRTSAYYGTMRKTREQRLRNELGHFF